MIIGHLYLLVLLMGSSQNKSPGNNLESDVGEVEGGGGYMLG